jgi:hypothetical protein
MKKAVTTIAAAALLASVPAFAATTLSGTYVGVIKGQPPTTRLNGTWALLINERGDYAIQKGGLGTVAFGHAKVVGNRITFQKEIGSKACKGKQASGRYTWALKGSTLKFKRLYDLCIGRRTVLGVPMKKYS